MIAEAGDEKSSAFSVSQEDIDSVLVKGSGVQYGKYRIYRQFWKHEDSKKNIEFLRNEYGTGGGTHFYPDGIRGHEWHDGKGILIEKQGSDTKQLLSWSKVEKRLRELIKNDRYLNPKEKGHYPDFLEKENAPQYEIDTQKKMQRQAFIDAKRDLPPADKRDTLALRLSDFIRDLDGYEKDLLSHVERTDLSDVTAEQMEQHLSDPAAGHQRGGQRLLRLRKEYPLRTFGDQERRTRRGRGDRGGARGQRSVLDDRRLCRAHVQPGGQQAHARELHQIGRARLAPGHQKAEADRFRRTP